MSKINSLIYNQIATSVSDKLELISLEDYHEGYLLKCMNLYSKETMYAYLIVDTVPRKSIALPGDVLRKASDSVIAFFIFQLDTTSSTMYYEELTSYMRRHSILIGKESHSISIPSFYNLSCFSGKILFNHILQFRFFLQSNEDFFKQTVLEIQEDRSLIEDNKFFSKEYMYHLYFTILDIRATLHPVNAYARFKALGDAPLQYNDFIDVLNKTFLELQYHYKEQRIYTIGHDEDFFLLINNWQAFKHSS